MNKYRKQPLALICLNEINLDLIARYPDGEARFPALTKLAKGAIRTISENREELLEPWIQWVSVYTGLTAVEHGVFRLGDVVGSSSPQLFEQLEGRGLSVGAISPMNAANRLKSPAYFIPDPWTSTEPDLSSLSRLLTGAIRQVVNDNSQNRVSLSSAVTLASAMLRFCRPENYGTYASLMTGTISDRWKRALVFDLFLNDFHLNRLKTLSPDFSSLFLNAGAHIQHHYMYNAAPLSGHRLRNPDWYIASSKDPMLDLARTYERIVTDYLTQDDVTCLFVTGLTQRPYDSTVYYWRLKEHERFLSLLKFDFVRVLPRMTRDFLIEFASADDATVAQSCLASLVCERDGAYLFEEIDNRGNSLFVTLTYPNEVSRGAMILNTNAVSLNRGAAASLDLHDHVVFVALKNGMHDPEGYVYGHGKIGRLESGCHVSKVHDLILDYFAR
jgi:hypothetical protein